MSFYLLKKTKPVVVTSIKAGTYEKEVDSNVAAGCSRSNRHDTTYFYVYVTPICD